MTTYEFLSDEWMEAMRDIRAECADRIPPPAHAVRINQVVTDTPFGAEPRHTYLDTTGGRVDVGFGTLEEPDATVTIDYATVRELALTDNPNAGMLALAAGKLKIDGDVAKMLLSLQTRIDPVEIEIAQRVRAITV